MTSNSRLDAARQYQARGIQPLPIAERQKAPTFPNWPAFRIDGNIVELFSEPGNIGVLLGEPSLGLIDIDLDAPEALTLAPHFLPPTGSVFGRASKRQSHWLYIVEPIPKTTKFLDPNRPRDSAMLVELRSTGAQTIFPPSTHPSGESVEWHQDGEPAHVDGAKLLCAVQGLAAATLLVRRYPAEGSRHEFALAISGGLVSAGWSADEISHFLQAVAEAAGDPETRDRASAGEYSAARITSGRPATGWPRLETLLGRDVARRLREWLSVSTGPSFNGSADSGPYRVEDCRILYERQTANGPISIPLSNFSAKITEEILLDDGREQTRAFQIEGSLPTGKALPPLRVPVDKFQTMSWPIESWGNCAIVGAGHGTKDRLRRGRSVSFRRSADPPHFLPYGLGSH